MGKPKKQTMSLVSPLSCSAHPLQPTYLFFCLSDARQFHSSMVKLCSSIDIVVYILTKFFGHRDRLLTMEKDNLRSEPKHIVFLSQLLLLFSFCHSCKTDNPLVETREVGTKAVVTTICSNPKCPKKITTWHSQPMMPGTKISAGNFLLCMAVLLAGSSISKARQVFLHMGLGCVSLNTYFRYQRVCIYRTFTKNFRKGSHIELITLTLHVAPPPQNIM